MWPFQRGAPTNGRHPDRVVQNLAHLDWADRAITPAISSAVLPGAIARGWLLQLEAEGRVRGLVTVVAALMLGRRAFATGYRHAQGVRAEAVEVCLQRQVGTRRGKCLLMLAAGAVPCRGKERGWRVQWCGTY